MTTYAEAHARLAALERQGDLKALESESRQILAQHRHFLWHMYLIVALLRSGRREEAGRELDDLMSYKFNIAERAFPEIKAAFPEKFDAHFILDTMKADVSFERGGAQTAAAHAGSVTPGSPGRSTNLGYVAHQAELGNCSNHWCLSR